MLETLSPRPLVLIVDDDDDIRSGLAAVFVKSGFAVATAEDVPALERALRKDGADVIILDLLLPGEDGLSACRRLSAAGAPPIIMLSALGDDADRIVGLEIGADDYLAKPCNPRELVARARAVLRRARDRSGPVAKGVALRFAGFTLDIARLELIDPDGVVLPLSGGEFRLLQAFLERPQRVLSRDLLVELAFGEGDVFDRAVDVQVSRLRRKLDRPGQELIRTVRGEGYIFAVKPERR
ncbi:MAG TPA: DNA-binding response regulator [Hyphomonadaceae bacterium]|nr:DNA-binding response regulator [Hyphomonadaceae bacterium]